MKVTNQVAHGGDVQIYAVDSIPAGAKKVTSKNDKILARGETSGHAHVLTGDVELFEFEGQTFAAVGKDGAYHQHIQEASITEEIFTVNKNISNCDHTKECRIEQGVYIIGIDQQFDPHASVWIQNKD